MTRLYAGLDVSDKSTHICLVDEAAIPAQFRGHRNSGDTIPNFRPLQASIRQTPLRTASFASASLRPKRPPKQSE